MSECCVIVGVLSGEAQPPEVSPSPPSPLWNLGRQNTRTCGMHFLTPQTRASAGKSQSPFEAGGCDHSKNAFALAESIQLRQFSSPWCQSPESP